MRYTPYILLIIFIGCTKTDLQLYKNYTKSQRKDCYAVAINADKQNTSDFYVVKTFDEYGILRHLKTQLWGLDYDTYVFDFDISYSSGKAVFKGSTKKYYWILDNPPPQDDNGPYIPPEPGAPRHPEEQLELRDTRDFEIMLDKKTGYALEVKYADSSDPALKLTYDKSGKLTGVGSYVVTTDNKGNILSILTTKPAEWYYYDQQLGVSFTYSNLNTVKKTQQYYETPYIFIHPLYSLLEVLNWGPFQPNVERTGVELLHSYYDAELVGEYGAPSPWLSATYVNQQYDENGNLMSYTFDGDLTKDYPGFINSETGQRQRIIEWSCNSSGIKK